MLLAAAFALSSAGAAQAIPRLPQCANNIDDDRDGTIDFPAEPGCANPTDASETDPGSPPQCSDGIDNEPPLSDGKIDYPEDPGCKSAADPSEVDTAPFPACSDGTDNDVPPDGSIDYPRDPGCISASDPREQNTACSDGLDNDGDGKIDFPSDWGCIVPSNVPDQTDNNEADPPQCDDGRDNDGDGKLDTDTNVAGQTADPGCSSPTDNDETDPPPPPPPACSDTIDNDLDGRIDYPNDKGCASPLDTDETDPPVTIMGPPPVGASSYPVISPFPVVRLRGRGVKGGSCQPRKTSAYAITGYVRARAYERRLRAGTTLTIYVTKAGFTGKYTRFRIWRKKAPTRLDRCARVAGGPAVPCPVN
jgi:hypothetical protein